MLRAYSEALAPWAAAVGGQMLEDVNNRDKAAWLEHAQEMSHAMRQTIREAPVGTQLHAALARQVTLIKSLPLEAAQRVHELTLQGLEDSTRFTEIAKEIMRSGEVAKSRAVLIARTEVARTASELTQARAVAVGSEQYIWRTAGDSSVRAGHKAMANKAFRWDTPPPVDEGGKIMHHHPGAIWNCRCYPEPIFGDD